MIAAAAQKQQKKHSDEKCTRDFVMKIQRTYDKQKKKLIQNIDLECFTESMMSSDPHATAQILPTHLPKFPTYLARYQITYPSSNLFC